MKKKISLLSLLMIFGFTVLSTTFLASNGHAEAGNMTQIQLILKKLNSSMANMKDFDALEEAGMDKKDVDRLRQAMKRKIKQMTTDAVDLIQAL